MMSTPTTTQPVASVPLTIRFTHPLMAHEIDVLNIRGHDANGQAQLTDGEKRQLAKADNKVERPRRRAERAKSLFFPPPQSRCSWMEERPE
ncbi:hypothetical protein [Saccharopolyspora pogona]|uniref:hypothetical protein n=1 Tax=Saccharopolyspora pogona TaxID=333966 RepID=UPI001684EA19|nr:hypothetical protein [Saccharopolyspora pogona]